jgi:2-hydroxychromene-2-carboxylate isomerase
MSRETVAEFFPDHAETISACIEKVKEARALLGEGEQVEHDGMFITCLVECLFDTATERQEPEARRSLATLAIRQLGIMRGALAAHVASDYIREAAADALREAKRRRGEN